MVPRGLEPRTLPSLAVRSNQLSYRTYDLRSDLQKKGAFCEMGTLVPRTCGRFDHLKGVLLVVVVVVVATAGRH